MTTVQASLNTLKSLEAGKSLFAMAAAALLSSPVHAGKLECASQVFKGQLGCLLPIAVELISPELAKQLGMDEHTEHLKKVDDGLKKIDAKMDTLLSVSKEHYGRYMADAERDSQDKLADVHNKAIMVAKAVTNVYPKFFEVTDYSELRFKPSDLKSIDRYFDANGQARLASILEELSSFDADGDDLVTKHLLRDRLNAYFDRLHSQTTATTPTKDVSDGVNPLALDFAKKPLHDSSNLVLRKKEYMNAVDVMAARTASVIEKLYQLHAFSVWLYYQEGDKADSVLQLPGFIKKAQRFRDMQGGDVESFRKEQYEKARLELFNYYAGNIGKTLADVRLKAKERFVISVNNIDGDWQNSCNRFTTAELANLSIEQIRKDFYSNGAFFKTTCDAFGIGPAAYYFNENFCVPDKGKINLKLVKSEKYKSARLFCQNNENIAWNPVRAKFGPFISYDSSSIWRSAREMNFSAFERMGPPSAYPIMGLWRDKDTNIIFNTVMTLGNMLTKYDMNYQFGCQEHDIYCKEAVGDTSYVELRYHDGSVARIDWEGNSPNKGEPKIKTSAPAR